MSDFGSSLSKEREVDSATLSLRAELYVNAPEHDIGNSFSSSVPSDAEKNNDTVVAITSNQIAPVPFPLPPDGGIAAWLQVFAAHITVFNTWGYINSFGLFQTYQTRLLSVSNSDISWIGSTQIFLLFFIGTFSGRLTDAGFFRLCFSVGLFLQLLGVFMTSICTEYWQFFLCQGVCTGTGNGLIFCPALSVVSTWFSTRRGLACGIAACGTATGGIVFPLLAQHLIPKIGFGWTVRVMGFIMLGMMMVPLAMTRTRLPPRKSGPIVEWAAFKEGPFALFAVGITLCFWGLYFAFYYIADYGTYKFGLSEKDSITFIVIINASGIPGRILPNLISDYWLGPINTMIPFALMSSILVYSWMAIDSKGALVAFAVLYGLCASGMLSLFPAAATSLSDDLSKSGGRLGIIMSCISFACLTGPPIGGWLLQARGGAYIGAQAYFGSVVAAAVGFLIGARFVKTTGKWITRV